MKPFAVVLAILAAALAAVAVSGAPQQWVAAGVLGVMALAFWRG